MLSCQIIKAVLPDDFKTLYVGYSGGIDSHVLLHVLSTDPQLKSKTCAVYIHHGLQAQADLWDAHCREAASQLGVAYQCIRVDGSKKNGQSPEESARIARYEAFKPLLQTDDVLLIAQHQEDQLETVLLQLFRGAGVQGLAGMPVRTGLGSGQLIRPFLNTTKKAIEDHANQHHLNWIEDPSNQSLIYDRNYLRQQIIPLLKQRWPALATTVSRSAGHCADLTDWIHQQVLAIWPKVYCQQRRALDLQQLEQQPESLKVWLLRFWFEQQGLKLPSQKLLQQIEQQFIHSDTDKMPVIKKRGYQLRRYRQYLYCVSEREAQEIMETKIWPNDQPVLALSALTHIQRVSADSGIAQAVWERCVVSVRYRQGSEKLSLPGRAGQHSLKKLFQEQGIPVWQRDKIPLIYLNDQLASVADLWIADDFFCNDGRPCYQLICAPSHQISS